ncbi:MAG: hypothetical protein KKD39_07335 [Candidatus Altiarchaeota archaeon]|nr:hypothetical protein [Candidatus Altiarchaeota archaeon]
MENPKPVNMNRRHLTVVQIFLILQSLVLLGSGNGIYAPISLFLALFIKARQIWVFGVMVLGSVASLLRAVWTMNILVIAINAYIIFALSLNYDHYFGKLKFGISLRNPINWIFKPKMVDLHIVQFVNNTEKTILSEYDFQIREGEVFYLVNSHAKPILQYPVKVEKASSDGVNIIAVAEEGNPMLQVVNEQQIRNGEKNLYKGEYVNLFNPKDMFGICWQITFNKAEKNTEKVKN